MAQIYNPITNQKVNVQRKNFSAEELENLPAYEPKGFIAFLHKNPKSAKILIITGMFLAATLVSRGIHDMIFGSDNIQRAEAQDYRDYRPNAISSFLNDTVCKGRQGSKYCD